METMMPSVSDSHSPHWYGVPVRILLVTFIATLLCFSVSLLLGIIATVVAAAIRGVQPDMRMAYRHIAVPLAVVEGTIIFVIATVMEIRHYRQRKALAALERLG
jgi:uncharacterized membrane protein